MPPIRRSKSNIQRNTDIQVDDHNLFINRTYQVVLDNGDRISARIIDGNQMYNHVEIYIIELVEGKLNEYNKINMVTNRDLIEYTDNFTKDNIYILPINEIQEVYQNSMLPGGGRKTKRTKKQTRKEKKTRKNKHTRHTKRIKRTRK